METGASEANLIKSMKEYMEGTSKNMRYLADTDLGRGILSSYGSGRGGSIIMYLASGMYMVHSRLMPVEEFYSRMGRHLEKYGAAGLEEEVRREFSKSFSDVGSA